MFVIMLIWVQQYNQSNKTWFITNNSCIRDTCGKKISRIIIAIDRGIDKDFGLSIASRRPVSACLYVSFMYRIETAKDIVNLFIGQVA